MSTDRLQRTTGSLGTQAVRYAVGGAGAKPAYTEARKVNEQIAYLTRGGAARFDKAATLPDCQPAYLEIDLDASLPARLRNFFKNATYQ
jgi:hypothetical protein